MIKIKRVCRFHKIKGIPIETKITKDDEFCPECKKESEHKNKRVNYGIRTAIYSEDPPLEK